MKISVIVPTYNRREVVLRTVSTLLRQNVAPEDYEIVVVVDGSTDGTAAALNSVMTDRRLRVIEQENRGLAGARNSGYRAAQADHILFLDDDMLCDPGLVEAHIAAHEEPGRIVVFGALFLSADSPNSLAAECFNREIGAFHLEYRRNHSIAWKNTDCVFSNSSISRSLLDQFGGFDEAFRMREDLEFGTRLFREGVRPRYIGNAIAYQYYFKSSTDLIKDAEAFAAADLKLARMHPDSPIAEQFKHLATEFWAKRKLRRLIAVYPPLTDLLLTPICALGSKVTGCSLLRDFGVRMLQLRRRVHWLHKILDLDPSALDLQQGH